METACADESSELWIISLIDPFPPAAQIVNHDVPTQLVGRGVEGSATIETCHPAHKVNEVIAGLAHESVDCDAFLGAPPHLFEDLLDSAVAGKIVEVDFPSR